ncbi:MAG TPA: RDD family protein [Candidatus Elarobacter sp.]|nr:RDD family protein [Candidatus Elarobacter sp.]
MTALFAGPESLRVRGERTVFVLTLLSLPITIAVLGWLFQHQLTWQEIALIVVLAMIYVAFARGRLLGGGLRIHAGQLAHVHAIVEECARMLRVPAPHVFVRDDPFVPVVGIGIGEPYAIVISAQYVEQYREDELRFLIGRELGHIASGHTRFTSLMSSNGRENGIIAMAFGAWLRRIDYTADRVGLLCCGSLDAALRAIAVSTFHSLGRSIDLGAFAEQLKELQAEPSLRMAEWTSSTPYATNRIAALHRFARDPLYLTWARRFAENAAAPQIAESRETVYAGFWRRSWAFVVDVLVVQTLVPAAHAVQTRLTPSDANALKAVSDDPNVPAFVKSMVASSAAQAAPAAAHAHNHVSFSVGSLDDALGTVALFVYAIVLVALVGQTFGMMVCDVRVVGPNRESRIGFGRAIARYVALFASFVTLVGLFSIFRRVQPFEKWSRTRLVSGSAAVRS